MKLKKNDDANKLVPKFKKIDRRLDKSELVWTKTNGSKCNFNIFALPLKFIEKIHNYEITLDKAIEEQAELKELINKLNDYGPRISKKAKEKNSVLEFARKLFDTRDEIIDLFRKGIFPYQGSAFRTKEEESGEESEEESAENKLEKIKNDYKKFIEYIENESKEINYQLFKDYFYSSVPCALAKKLYKTKNKKENDKLVNVIKSGLIDLENKIEQNISKWNKNWKTR